MSYLPIKCRMLTVSHSIESQTSIAAPAAETLRHLYPLNKMFLFTEDLWEQAVSQPCPWIPLDQVTLAHWLDHLSVSRLKLLFQKRSKLCKIVRCSCWLFEVFSLWIIVYFLVSFRSLYCLVFRMMFFSLSHWCGVKLWIATLDRDSS